MILNKLKNLLLKLGASLNIALMAAFLVYFGSPELVRAEIAKLREKEANAPITIAESQSGRLFNPKATDLTTAGRINAVITVYTSTPDQTDSTPFIAAKGTRVYDGMIAANWLPIGTKIKIPSLYGDKIFTVDDRMNKRYGHGRMDIWLDMTKAQAKKLGVMRVPVEIFYQS